MYPRTRLSIRPGSSYVASPSMRRSASYAGESKHQQRAAANSIVQEMMAQARVSPRIRSSLAQSGGPRHSPGPAASGRFTRGAGGSGGVPGQRSTSQNSLPDVRQRTSYYRSGRGSIGTNSNNGMLFTRVTQGVEQAGTPTPPSRIRRASSAPIVPQHARRASTGSMTHAAAADAAAAAAIERPGTSHGAVMPPRAPPASPLQLDKNTEAAAAGSSNAGSAFPLDAAAASAVVSSASASTPESSSTTSSAVAASTSSSTAAIDADIMALGSAPSLSASAGRGSRRHSSASSMDATVMAVAHARQQQVDQLTGRLDEYIKLEQQWHKKNSELQASLADARAYQTQLQQELVRSRSKEARSAQELQQLQEVHDSAMASMREGERHKLMEATMMHEQALASLNHQWQERLDRETEQLRQQWMEQMESHYDERLQAEKQRLQEETAAEHAAEIKRLRQDAGQLESRLRKQHEEELQEHVDRIEAVMKDEVKALQQQLEAAGSKAAQQQRELERVRAALHDAQSGKESAQRQEWEKEKLHAALLQGLRTDKRNLERELARVRASAAEMKQASGKQLSTLAPTPTPTPSAVQVAAADKSDPAATRSASLQPSTSLSASSSSRATPSVPGKGVGRQSTQSTGTSTSPSMTRRANVAFAPAASSVAAASSSQVQDQSSSVGSPVASLRYPHTEKASRRERYESAGAQTPTSPSISKRSKGVVGILKRQASVDMHHGKTRGVYKSNGTGRRVRFSNNLIAPPSGPAAAHLRS